jgi:hypothetical protein
VFLCFCVLLLRGFAPPVFLSPRFRVFLCQCRGTRYRKERQTPAHLLNCIFFGFSSASCATFWFGTTAGCTNREAGLPVDLFVRSCRPPPLAWVHQESTTGRRVFLSVPFVGACGPHASRRESGGFSRLISGRHDSPYTGWTGLAPGPVRKSGAFWESPWEGDVYQA